MFTTEVNDPEAQSDSKKCSWMNAKKVNESEKCQQSDILFLRHAAN